MVATLERGTRWRAEKVIVDAEEDTRRERAAAERGAVAFGWNVFVIVVGCLIAFVCLMLGDLIGWFPYAVKFKEKHGCRLTCVMSPLIIPLFRDAYPEISFITHEEVRPEQFYATYSIPCDAGVDLLVPVVDDAGVHQRGDPVADRARMDAEPVFPAECAGDCFGDGAEVLDAEPAIGGGAPHPGRSAATARCRWRALKGLSERLRSARYTDDPLTIIEPGKTATDQAVTRVE